MSSRTENPLVSVIVPVYNVASFLPRCLESIIEQTYQDIEIILVDDGSCDESGTICDELSEHDDRVVVIHKDNGGLSDARNKALEQCTGDYLTFVDGDDVISRDMIQELVAVAVGQSAQMVVCEVVHAFDDAEIGFRSGEEVTILTPESALCGMLYQSLLPSACAKLYSSVLFSDIRFPKGKIFEDVAIMGDLFEACERIACLDSYLYGYMHREGSITTTSFNKKDLFILDICDGYEERYRTEGEDIKRAVMAYKTNCCLRVLLNAPRSAGYDDVIRKCSRYINKSALRVLCDRRARRKLKMGIVANMLPYRLTKSIYAKVDRWS